MGTELAPRDPNDPFRAAVRGILRKKDKWIQTYAVVRDIFDELSKSEPSYIGLAKAPFRALSRLLIQNAVAQFVEDSFFDGLRAVDGFALEKFLFDCGEKTDNHIQPQHVVRVLQKFENLCDDRSVQEAAGAEREAALLRFRMELHDLIASSRTARHTEQQRAELRAESKRQFSSYIGLIDSTLGRFFPLMANVLKAGQTPTYKELDGVQKAVLGGIQVLAKGPFQQEGQGATIKLDNFGANLMHRIEYSRLPRNFRRRKTASGIYEKFIASNLSESQDGLLVVGPRVGAVAAFDGFWIPYSSTSSGIVFPGAPTALLHGKPTILSVRDEHLDKRWPAAADQDSRDELKKFLKKSDLGACICLPVILSGDDQAEEVVGVVNINSRTTDAALVEQLESTGALTAIHDILKPYLSMLALIEARRRQGNIYNPGGG